MHIPPTNLLLLAATQEQKKNKQKNFLFTKNIDFVFFLEKVQRKDQQAQKVKIERVTGLGRRTREEIAK